MVILPSIIYVLDYSSIFWSDAHIFDQFHNELVLISTFDQQSDVVIFNAFCLSVSRPSQRDTVQVVMRFENDLLYVFTCYLGHYTERFAGERFAANCLVINTWQLLVWDGRILSVTKGCIRKVPWHYRQRGRPDQRKGGGRQNMSMPCEDATRFVWSWWTFSFLLLL